MPTYNYRCKCSHKFEDVKGIKAYCEDPHATCPKCEHVCGIEERDYSQNSFTFIGTAVKSAEYNPGLGCIVKDDYHKSELLKKKGLVEVGNDFNGGENMQKDFEKKKQAEKDKKWEDPKEFFL